VGCLFHDESILDGFDPFNASSDLARLIFSVLRIHKAAQLYDAFACFYANLKGLEQFIGCELSFYFGRDDGIIDDFPGA